MTHRVSNRPFVLAGLVLSASLLLTSCSNPIENAIGSISSSVADDLVSGSTGTDIEGLGSVDIPDDFPNTVPLPEATPFNAVAVTSDGVRGWMIQYRGNFDNALYDDAVAKIIASGFSEEESSNINGVMNLTLLSNSEHTVNVSLMGPANDERILQIMVTDLSG